MTALPAPDSLEFEEGVRDFALSHDLPEMTFRQILADQSRTADDRFAALYGLLQELHREQRMDEYRSLCQTYQPTFGHLPYYLAFRANSVADDGSSDTGLRQAMRLLHQAIRQLPDRPGLLHQYASTCASLIELDGRPHKSVLDLALQRVERAIDLAPEPTNPIYRFTHARLLRSIGRTAEALTEVRLAVTTQESRTAGGVRRLARFEALRSVLVVEASNERLLTEIAKARDELRGARGEQIQLLGVLAAVIALITSSVAITQHISEPSAVRFFLLTTGAVGIVFSGLSWAASTASFLRLLAPFLCSLALVLLGLYALPVS